MQKYPARFAQQLGCAHPLQGLKLELQLGLHIQERKDTVIMGESNALLLHHEGKCTRLDILLSVLRCKWSLTQEHVHISLVPRYSAY